MWLFKYALFLVHKYSNCLTGALSGAALNMVAEILHFVYSTGQNISH